MILNIDMNKSELYSCINKYLNIEETESRGGIPSALCSLNSEKNNVKEYINVEELVGEYIDDEDYFIDYTLLGIEKECDNIEICNSIRNTADKIGSSYVKNVEYNLENCGDVSENYSDDEVEEDDFVDYESEGSAEDEEDFSGTEDEFVDYGVEDEEKSLGTDEDEFVDYGKDEKESSSTSITEDEFVDYVGGSSEEEDDSSAWTTISGDDYHGDEGDFIDTFEDDTENLYSWDLEEEYFSLETEKGSPVNDYSGFDYEDEVLENHWNDLESERNYLDKESSYLDKDYVDSENDYVNSENEKNILDNENSVSDKEFFESFFNNSFLEEDKKDLEIKESYVDLEKQSISSNLVSEKISTESEKVAEDIPKDLRDFVRKNPNCEISLALQYFSKKEIDRQLNLGRVFKRKNRLWV